MLFFNRTLSEIKISGNFHNSTLLYTQSSPLVHLWHVIRYLYEIICEVHVFYIMWPLKFLDFLLWIIGDLDAFLLKTISFNVLSNLILLVDIFFAQIFPGIPAEADVIGEIYGISAYCYSLYLYVAWCSSPLQFSRDIVRHCCSKYKLPWWCC